MIFEVTETLRNQKGTVVVIVAILLIAIMAFTALAIDVGRYMVVQNELQNIADSAALAGCRVLGNIYQNLPISSQQNYTCNSDDQTSIITAARTVASRNQSVEVDSFTIMPEDVIIGIWNRDTNTIIPTLDQPDAVRVISRRDGVANPLIAAIFARIIGKDTMQASKEATAALTGQSTTEPGEIELPIGISSYFFPEDDPDGRCNDFIVFNPTNDPDSCAGWNSYDISPPNDNLLRNILNGDPISPATTADETEFNFIGGNLSNPTFDALLSLFQRRGYDTRADGVTPVAIEESYDDDGNFIQQPITGSLTPEDGDVVPIAEDGLPLYETDGSIRLDEDDIPLEQAQYPDGTLRNLHRWETTVVVYEWDTCDNPNTSITIAGYTKIVMTNVITAPDKRIEGEIMCNLYSQFDTRGGGGEFGVKGTIPGLVK